MPHDAERLLHWVDSLRRLARSVLGDSQPPEPGDFADEFGHRRAVDAPFLAWRRRRAGLDAPAPPEADPARAPDVALWRALLDADADPEEVFRAHAARFGEPTDGLFARADTGIEVWTETELASLHALWWIVHERSTPSIERRLEHAVRAHMETMQPDNATNHPWALHVFVIHAQQSGDLEAELYAQTQVSNCQVSLGRPDSLSAHILADAAGALEAAARAG